VAVPREAIRTQRLVLEPVDETHDQALQDAVQSSIRELEYWMPWAPGHTIDTQRAFRARAVSAWRDGSEYHFAVLLHDKPIGTVGLHHRGPGAYEIGYWMRTDETRRGYTTEAARAAIDFAFSNLDTERIILNAGVENVPSLRVAQKLGFTRIGPLSGGMDGGNGAHFKALTHELKRENWMTQKQNS
jgi:RimJ/RimL family protein N-acetyltransferase